MNDRRTVRISKYLARHLRHDPGRIGITLDSRGWVRVTELLEAAARHGFSFTAEELQRAVRTNDKQRYILQDGWIRANQGHSVPVELDLPEMEPPALLYHGTVPATLPAIRAEGLKSMRRHHVHLSPDPDTATRVAARRGRPVVLTVDSAAMYAEGHAFHVSLNGVWLTGHVPPRFLGIPE
jgi:putative RNA 2'-phosphotransferase